MQEVPIEQLRKAILRLHGCASTFLESVPVIETFKGKTVWDGVVQVFELRGHSKASKCYAWSHETDDKWDRRKINRRFVVVLHQGKIDSPQAAVKAAHRPAVPGKPAG